MSCCRKRYVVAGLVLAGHNDLAAEIVKADGWDTLPEGWTKESLRKYWKSIGGDVKTCMKELDGKVTDPGAFCASIKDKLTGSTKWRGKR